MEPITITKDGTIIAHHTTESCLSHYGQPVWVVEDEDPGEGKAIWSQGENEQPLQIIGVLGGWLIAAQSNGLLLGIIWSDGSYYANLIVRRDSDLPARKDTTLNELRACRHQVQGVVAGLFDDDSPLGCILLG